MCVLFRNKWLFSEPKQIVLVLLREIGGTRTRHQRARTLVTTLKRRTRDVGAHARSWTHTHNGRTRTRDVTAHAHETSMQRTLVNAHTRRPRTNTRRRRARTLVNTHTMATCACEHARTRARSGRRWVSLLNDGHAWMNWLCDWRMQKSDLFVADTDSCRGQQCWVSTNN